MAIKHSPGCTCCGCRIIEQQLFPDFYYPLEIKCFKRYREQISVRTVVTQLTRTWVDSVQTNNSTTISDDTVLTDETTDSITTDVRAGRFEWVYPQTFTITDLVIESETGTPGVNGTRTFEPQTSVTTNRTINEEYRLVYRYNVSEQYNFGRLDAASVAILKAATARLGGTAYAIAGWVGATGQTNQAIVKGMFADATIPTDAASFDTLWASGSNSSTMSVSSGSDLNILSWLPSTDSTSLYLLFYQDTNKRGLNIIESGKITIWDRTPVSLSSPPYDWQTHWVQEDYNQWRTKSFLPKDNYEIDLTELLPSGFWNTEARELEFHFVQLNEDGSDADIVATQRFFVSIGDTIPDTSNREWRIRSDGTWGVVDHVIVINSRTGFPLDGFTMFSGNWGPKVKVRGSVYELIGNNGTNQGRRVESGTDVFYRWVPYYHGLGDGGEYGYGSTELPRFHLRLTITSDNPQQVRYKETGLQHIDDEKKLTCPGNYTCSVIDDYAHPEFRVISQSLPSLSPVFSPFSVSHSVCQATAVTSAPIDTFEFNWEVSEYFHALYAFYGVAPDNNQWISTDSTFSVDENVIVFTEDTTTSWDISAPKHVTIAVKVSDYFATHVRTGLPSYPGAFKHGQHILVNSGTGEGLVFLVDVQFASGNTEYSYNFTCVAQSYIPVLDVDTLDTSAIAAVLGSVVYWVQGLDGLFYSLSSSGTLSAAFEEPGAIIPDLVDVQAIYTLEISAAPAEDGPFAGDFPPPDNNLSYYRHSGGTPYEFTDTNVTGLPSAVDPPTFDTPPATAPDPNGGPDLDLEDVEERIEKRYSRFQIQGGKGSLGDFANTYEVVFEFVKQVPRWQDRDIPTISFDSTNLLKNIVVDTPASLVTLATYKLFTEFIRATSVEFIQQHEREKYTESFFATDTTPATDVLNESFSIRASTVFPSDRKVAPAVMKYTREVHDAEDITFTIGPSSYVPPATP